VAEEDDGAVQGISTERIVWWVATVAVIGLCALQWQNQQRLESRIDKLETERAQALAEVSSVRVLAERSDVQMTNLLEGLREARAEIAGLRLQPVLQPTAKDQPSGKGGR